MSTDNSHVIDFLHRVCFTRCPKDPKVYVLDVRDRKDFRKKHIAWSYCIRLAANGRTLLDYSQAEYHFPWSPDAYWGQPVVVYGEKGLKRDHPVISFLEAEGRAEWIGMYRDGIESFEARFPFCVTPSVKQNCVRAYPSQILPGELYLGKYSATTQPGPGPWPTAVADLS